MNAKTRLGLITAAVVLFAAFNASSGAGQDLTDSGAPSPSIPYLSELIPIRIDDKPNENYAVAYNSVHDEFLAVWVDKQDEFTWDIWGRRIGGDGVLDPYTFCIATSAGVHLDHPDVAYSSEQDQYFVVFEGYGDPDTEIFAVTFDYDGNNISPWIYVDVWVFNQMHPAVAYNSEDDEYLVVYSSQTATQSEYDVWGARFDASNFDTWIQKKIAPYDSSQSWNIKMPDVAYNPAQNNYLLTYTKVRSDHNPDYVASRLISADLNTISAETNLKMLSFDAETAVAAGQNEFMVVWGFNYMNARRVNSGGTPLGPADGIFFSTQTYPFRTLHPQVSASTLGYWILWMRYDSSDESSSDIYGNLIPLGTDQAAGAEYAVDTFALYQGYPSIACRWWGTCFMVETWTDPHALDHEILGRFIGPHSIYLPVVRR